MPDSSEVLRTAHAALDVLMACRRGHQAPTPGDRLQIEAAHLPMLIRQIERAAPLHLVIPAFPVKSPSLRKVIGTLPDLGERLALAFLNALCERLRLIYPPGARLTICSDGHVFGPVLSVTDATIDGYQCGIERMIHELGGACLETFALSQCDELPVAEDGCYEAPREALIARYGVPLEIVRERLLATEEGVRQFTGVLRFMLEDRQALDAGRSRSAARRLARDAAYAVLQRSWAWGELLATRFPDALRLSIHPQPPASIKFGIHMLPTCNDWITPWHGVVATDGERFELMKRHHAEALDGRLVCVDGQPSHFVVDRLPSATSKEARRPAAC